MRQPAFCLCENKGADQLCGYCTADQCLCFRYIDIVEAPDEKSHHNHFGWPPVYQKFPLYSCLVHSFGSMKTNVCIFLGLAKVLLF